MENKSPSPSNDQNNLTLFYKSQPSDSLLKIAFTFNMSLPLLKRINNIISDDLYPGQIFKVIVDKDAEILKSSDIGCLLAESEEELKMLYPATPAGGGGSFSMARGGA